MVSVTKFIMLEKTKCGGNRWTADFGGRWMYRKSRFSVGKIMALICFSLPAPFGWSIITFHLHLPLYHLQRQGIKSWSGSSTGLYMTLRGWWIPDSFDILSWVIILLRVCVIDLEKRGLCWRIWDHRDFKKYDNSVAEHGHVCGFNHVRTTASEGNGDKGIF